MQDKFDFLPIKRSKLVIRFRKKVIFAETMLGIINKDPGMIIMISNEAQFHHLNDYLNKQNFRYWVPHNLQDLHSCTHRFYLTVKVMKKVQRLALIIMIVQYILNCLNVQNLMLPLCLDSA